MSKIANDNGLNPVWHRMLYSCSHMATVGVKELKTINIIASKGDYIILAPPGGLHDKGAVKVSGGGEGVNVPLSAVLGGDAVGSQALCVVVVIVMVMGDLEWCFSDKAHPTMAS